MLMKLGTWRSLSLRIESIGFGLLGFKWNPCFYGGLFCVWSLYFCFFSFSMNIILFLYCHQVTNFFRQKIIEPHNSQTYYIYPISKDNNHIIMSKSNDKRSIMKLPVDHPLYRQANWVTEEVNYNQCSYQQLEDENHHILVTLKLIESRLSQELKQKKLSNLVQVHPKPPENLKALQEKIKNNQKYIQVLKRDIDQAEARKVALNQGLESKTLDIKLSLERRIQMLKQELKKMKLEEHDTEKRLIAHGGQMNKPEYMEEHKRMEEELRCLSVKYVRLLDKYNKSVEQLAILSNIDIDQIEIPEHIYDNQLEERQQVQYKEYQGIVKLCKVLSHRNDSEHNKAHREYTLKLKELEKVIMNLGQLDHSITTKEGEIIESRKNIELMKIKYQNGESGRQQLKLSQASMPRTKSYSSANLPHSQRIKGRGSSFVKLPKSIHS